MSKGRWLAIAAAACVLSGAGCGDEPVCPSELVVVITAPDPDAILSDADDTDPDQDGIQIAVTVRSNLERGDRIEVTVGTGTPVSGEVDDDGTITFAGVTVPSGDVELAATGSSDDCGSGDDQIAMFVGGDGLCQLTVDNGPIANPNLDPLLVLNSVNDDDASNAGFQAGITVSTGPAFSVELLVVDPRTGEETSTTAAAGDDGAAAFDVTLEQGTQVLRAICRSPSGGAASGTSPASTFFVDTIAPACDLVAPALGGSVTPDDDLDADLANGIQIQLRGSSDSADADGQIGTFAIGGDTIDGTALTGGESTASGSFGSPGSAAVSFTIADTAGNTCSAAGAVDVELAGCPIAHELPDAIVVTDADPATGGLQADIQVQVDTATHPECAGLTATTDCGAGGSAVVPGDGQTVIRVTLAANASAEGSDDCQTGVTHPSGFGTFAGATIAWDTLAPPCSLLFLDPTGVSCPGAVSIADDVTAGTPGVQIDVAAAAPLAATREIELNGTPIATGPGGEARITLSPGANTLQVVAADANGNVCRSPAPACDVVLQEIGINFSPPIADGVVGVADDDDGDTSGGLTLDLCGTVSDPTAAVTVAIDGGGGVAATAPGDGTWCLTAQTLAGGVHDITVNAIGADGVGTNALSLDVDLAPPDAPSGLALSVPNRQAIAAEWTAPDAGGGAAVAAYTAKISGTAFSEANFDTNGIEVAAPVPGAPGGIDSLTVNQQRPGDEVFFAVAAIDGGGNRSLIAAGGPIVPDLDVATSVLAPDPAAGNNGLGFALARGRFNNDAFGDVAVAAPFGNTSVAAGGNVYIYFGGATGLSATPNVTISGSQLQGQLGNGLASVRWDGDSLDDLVIGAPFQDVGAGRVYVFSGAQILGAAGGALLDVDAEVTISVSTSTPNAFTNGGCGWSVAGLRFDSDGLDDIALSCVVAENNNGAVAVVFGGGGDAAVALSDVDSSGMPNTRAVLVRDPSTSQPFDLFGTFLFNLGRTQGSVDPGDDLGIAYFQSPRAVVVRGVTKPSLAGVTTRNISASSDLTVLDSSGDATTFFGASMGTVSDLNTDGARDIVIGSHGEGADDGRLVIVDGNAVGARTVAQIGIATVTAAIGIKHFAAAIANNDAGVGPDVDADGVEDLVVIGGRGAGNVGAFIWFGGALPLGSATSASAQHVVSLPADFTSARAGGGSTPISAIWAGDVNADGLTDICVGDQNAQGLDGAFTFLWDDGL